MVSERWYAVCEGADVHRAPVALARLGERLVAWRDDAGAVRVAQDRCPHKGVALSRGRVCEGRLVCPYHGFRFDGDGQCVHTPVHPDRTPSRSLRLRSWSVREAHGLVWVWLGRGKPAADVPWFDELAGERPAAASSALVYPVHHSRVVESNFDVYHFPFVHRTLDPGLGAEVVDMAVEVDGEAIATRGALRSAKGVDTPFQVDFLPPNLQRLRFAGIDGIIVSTPIDAETTWVWARYEQSVVRRPVFLARWVSALTLWFEWNVVQTRQDLPMLTSLQPREAGPGSCVWVRADAGAARYVQWRSRQPTWGPQEPLRAPTAV